MVSPQNQNPIVAIENIVLPSDFSVEVASKNVRTIRMFEDDQQMKLTSEYLKYIQQSRVLPNSTNKDKWTVDVCVSKPRKMKVFIKKSRNLSSNFTKAYRSNRVLFFFFFFVNTTGGTSIILANWRHSALFSRRRHLG